MHPTLDEKEIVRNVLKDNALIPPFYQWEELAQWFLYNMPMEMRHKLMAERPMLYARLYPDVPAHAITDQVKKAIQKERYA